MSFEIELGDLTVGHVTLDEMVVVHFPKALHWLGLRAGQARALAAALLRHAHEMELELDAQERGKPQ